jgi:hypothetical protein
MGQRGMTVEQIEAVLADLDHRKAVRKALRSKSKPREQNTVMVQQHVGHDWLTRALAQRRGA